LTALESEQIDAADSTPNAVEHVKSRWTRGKTVVQFCVMWRAFAAVLLFVAPAFAQEENATAYEALRVVGTELGRGALNHVVAITGTT